MVSKRMVRKPRVTQSNCMSRKRSSFPRTLIMSRSGPDKKICTHFGLSRGMTKPNAELVWDDVPILTTLQFKDESLTKGAGFEPSLHTIHVHIPYIVNTRPIAANEEIILTWATIFDIVAESDAKRRRKKCNP